MNEELFGTDIKRSFEWKGRLRLIITGVFTGMSAFVWWFLLYPELCFPQDTYEIVYEAEGEEESFSEEEIYNQLMMADDGQIVIKSKILEWLKKK